MDVEVDARPSDAIVLALRSGAPIFASDEVMAEMGVTDEAGRFAGLYPDDEEAQDGRVLH